MPVILFFYILGPYATNCLKKYLGFIHARSVHAFLCIPTLRILGQADDRDGHILLSLWGVKYSLSRILNWIIQSLIETSWRKGASQISVQSSPPNSGISPYHFLCKPERSERVLKMTCWYRDDAGLEGWSVSSNFDNEEQYIYSP